MVLFTGFSGRNDAGGAVVAAGMAGCQPDVAAGKFGAFCVVLDGDAVDSFFYIKLQAWYLHSAVFSRVGDFAGVEFDRST